jgi:hypothetical protein
MPDKSFEYLIPFQQFRSSRGPVWLPLVTVTLLQQPGGQRVDLPLIFDTGASTTTLRHDLFPLLGLADWNVGQAGSAGTAGGQAQFYRYTATLEFFGRQMSCPVHLMQLPPGPYMGLFGREQVFHQFGFGFWESTHEIHVTLNP